VNAALYKWADTGTGREFIVYYSSFKKKIKRKPARFPCGTDDPGYYAYRAGTEFRKNQKKGKDHFGL